MKEERVRLIHGLIITTVFVHFCMQRGPAFGGDISGNSSANEPPWVKITQPSSGRLFSIPATIRIAAELTLPSTNLSAIQIIANQRLLCTLTNQPYTFVWTHVIPDPDRPAGQYTLFAVAQDPWGATSTSAPVYIQVIQDFAPPVIKITAPASGTSFIVPAQIPVSSEVYTTDGSENPVKYYQGSNLLATVDYPYSFILSNRTEGEFLITASVRDNLGNIGTSEPILVRVGKLLLRDPEKRIPGSFSFTVLTTLENTTHRVQVSTNMVTWDLLESLFPATNSFPYRDDRADLYPQRFYRVVVP